MSTFLASSLLPGNVTEASPRHRHLLNEDWQFRLGDSDAPDAWRTLDLPHDWGVESGFDISLPGETGKLRWWGEAWYRKTLRLEPGDAQRLVSLEIEGAMSNATVWVNGHRAGGWAYGYTSFRVDLTPYLKFNDEDGGNLIAIHLDNPPDSSRWYPGGGLYRNVWLHKTGRVHVVADSPVVTTRELAADHSRATLDVACELSNATSESTVVRVITHLREWRGDNAGMPLSEPVASIPSAFIEVPAGSSMPHVASIELAYPKLWDVHSVARASRPLLQGMDLQPGIQKTGMDDGDTVRARRLRHTNNGMDAVAPAALYVAEVIIEDARTGALLDRIETRFGIRTARFDPKTGFHLNQSAEPTRIQGVCLHHDLGPLGAAAHPDAIARQLTLLRELGCNAIRCAHNPPAPALLDLCDRMGFLVMDELCDTWRIAKKPNGYQTLFDDWVERDLRAMVRRDRHHPSIVLWSIGNEIPEQTSSDGPALSARLAGIVREEDPERRPVTGGMNIPESGFNGWQRAYDVFGYNYKPHLYAEFRKANPGIPLIGAETASTISTRGEYVFPVSDDPSDGMLPPPVCQISSYDLSAPQWATTPDAEFAAQDASAPAVAGEFVWTGFDYLGEPTPFNDDPTNLLNGSDPTMRAAIVEALKKLRALDAPLPARSSYFGIFDLCGFPKDRYYLYQARWRPDLPMAHILPHWDWPERIGQNTPVHVYTSGDEAELFLNNRSLGVRRRVAPGVPTAHRLRWDHVIYEPGELRVVVRKNNRSWAEAIRRTTGPATRIELRADYFPAAASSADATLAFVTARITDASGQLSPRAKHLLHFDLPPDSPLRLLASDNGDPTRLAPFASPDCPAFNGLALAILRLPHPRTTPPPFNRHVTLTVRSSDNQLTPAALRV
ncbi:glycoside hydrolase family 2 TIM barrel-domain containing protein [Geminisphaera colitermitum]|uniref:glycoside hydrolase family 2 TIM barrel-domain containing protein n=1 Tax=Geminisphaera colitermitum TaxID=1148786 RepID=UPI00019655DC|nr:glycoside hydrolase family 2 TIM barrel-domain containing protein [Geminisphaera colitermitum]